MCGIRIDRMLDNFRIFLVEMFNYSYLQFNVLSLSLNSKDYQASNRYLICHTRWKVWFPNSRFINPTHPGRRCGRGSFSDVILLTLKCHPVPTNRPPDPHLWLPLEQKPLFPTAVASSSSSVVSHSSFEGLLLALILPTPLSMKERKSTGYVKWADGGIRPMKNTVLCFTAYRWHSV